jgi:hypothetical protein
LFARELLVGSGEGLLLIVRVGIYYGCLMVVKVNTPVV